MTTAEAIAERRKKFSTTLPSSDIWGELDTDTENLIRGSPFAFLVAVAVDRGMRWQKAGGRFRRRLIERVSWTTSDWHPCPMPN